MLMVNTKKNQKIKTIDNESGFSVVELILVILIILVLGAIGWLVYENQHKATKSVPMKTSTKSLSTQSKIVTFSGKVTNISHDCNFDGSCSVTVDNKVVITGGGLGPTPDSNVYGYSKLDTLNLGDIVNVRAVKDKYGYTLQGCTSCFVVK